MIWTSFVLGILVGWGLTRYCWLADRDRLQADIRRRVFQLSTLYHPNNLQEDSCADDTGSL